MSSADAEVPAAEIAHMVPGRVRLHIAGRRGDTAFFDAAAEWLRALPSVTRASGNPVTGSLIIEYDAAVSADQFGEFATAAERAGVLRLVDGASQDRKALPGVPPPPLEMASVGFAGLGVYQLARGQLVGNAVENFWNAYGAAVTLRRPLVSGVLIGLGLYQALNGQVLGSATSLLFYALSARHMARTGDAEAAS